MKDLSFVNKNQRLKRAPIDLVLKLNYEFARERALLTENRASEAPPVYLREK